MSEYDTLESLKSRAESPVSFTTLTPSIASEKATDTAGVEREFVAEESKAALHYSPEIVPYLIHFSSLLFTAIVLQLGYRNVYWADEDGWNKNGWSMGLSQQVMSGLLQFCAKLHEVSIQASLSAIAIDIIRRRLLVSRGVPFGFLVGGYRFGTANSVFSGSFWGPFIHSIRHRKLELIGLGFFLGLGAIYANAVGPASAVLIVPTLNWWPAYDLTTLMEGDQYPYPQRINQMLWMEGSCLDHEDLLSGCPGIGAGDLQNIDHYTRPEDLANRTMTQRYGKASKNLYTSPAITPPAENSIIHISSTMHSFVLEAIGLGGRFVSAFADSSSPLYKIGRPQLVSTDSSVLSPIVKVECKATSFDNIRSGVDNLTFPETILPAPTHITDNSDWKMYIPEENWPIDAETLQVPDMANLTWVDKQLFHYSSKYSKDNFDVSYDASIGAIASIPYTSPYIPGKWDVMLVACVLDARWAATQLSYDPASSDTVYSNITDMSLFSNASADADLRAKLGLSNTLYVTTEWAKMLNSPVMQNASWTFAFEHYLENLAKKMADVRDDSLYPNVTSDIAKFLSLTLADGLSRVGTKNEAIWAMLDDRASYFLASANYADGGFFTAINDTIKRTGLRITFNVRRYGWGYGIQSKTAGFATGILFIHAVLAIGYMIFTMAHWFLYRWSSRSWKSMEQLFALAMVSSQPSSLKGVSAGVGTWDTWKLEVAIREDEELHDRIELAFGERDGGPVGRKEGKIRWRKRYR